MRLLLDTHIAVWAVATPQRLSKEAQTLLQAKENAVYYSIVTLWEIAIKNSLSKRKNLPFSAQAAATEFEQAGLQFLPFQPEHVPILEKLPFLHRDPFDRLLAAQALGESLRLVTHDRTLASYAPDFILA